MHSSLPLLSNSISAPDRLYQALRLCCFQSSGLSNTLHQSKQTFPWQNISCKIWSWCYFYCNHWITCVLNLSLYFELWHLLWTAQMCFTYTLQNLLHNKSWLLSFFFLCFCCCFCCCLTSDMKNSICFCPKGIGVPWNCFSVVFFFFCVELNCVMHTFIQFQQWDVTWQLQKNVFDIPQTLAYMIKPKDSKDYMWILNSALWIQKWVSLPPCEYTCQ